MLRTCPSSWRWCAESHIHVHRYTDRCAFTQVQVHPGTCTRGCIPTNTHTCSYSHSSMHRLVCRCIDTQKHRRNMYSLTCTHTLIEKYTGRHIYRTPTDTMHSLTHLCTHICPTHYSPPPRGTLAGPAHTGCTLWRSSSSLHGRWPAGWPRARGGGWACGGSGREAR